MKIKGLLKRLQYRQVAQSKKLSDNANNTSVLEEFERCVMCGELTPIPVSMPVEFRENYELGCGQLCNACQRKMWQDAET